MIALFDSGLGGLTVVRELFRQLPGYDTLYFGDTARLPYGSKSPEVIRRFAAQNTDFLLSKGLRLSSSLATRFRLWRRMWFASTQSMFRCSR